MVSLYHSKTSRMIHLCLGLVSCGLGVLGAFLPVMPSTCFFILAAYFFGKSSQRWETWILNHPRFGPSVCAWRKYRAISLVGKMAAASGMTLGLVMLWLAQTPLWVALLGSGFILLSAIYVLSRPTFSRHLVPDQSIV